MNNTFFIPAIILCCLGFAQASFAGQASVEKLRAAGRAYRERAVAAGARNNQKVQDRGAYYAEKTLMRYRRSYDDYNYGGSGYYVSDGSYGGGSSGGPSSSASEETSSTKTYQIDRNGSTAVTSDGRTYDLRDRYGSSVGQATKSGSLTYELRDKYGSRIGEARETGSHSYELRDRNGNTIGKVDTSGSNPVYYDKNGNRMDHAPLGH